MSSFREGVPDPHPQQARADMSWEEGIQAEPRTHGLALLLSGCLTSEAHLLGQRDDVLPMAGNRKGKCPAGSPQNTEGLSKLMLGQRSAILTELLQRRWAAHATGHGAAFQMVAGDSCTRRPTPQLLRDRTPPPNSEPHVLSQLAPRGCAVAPRGTPAPCQQTLLTWIPLRRHATA